MNIIIVGPVYPFRGGIAHFGGCLYKELVRQKHNVTMINLRSQYPALIFPGKSQFESNNFFQDIPSKRVLTPYNPVTYNVSLSKIFESNPDLVLFNYFIPLFSIAYSFLIRRLKNKDIPSSIIAHNIISHEKWPFADYLTKRMLSNADSIITLSDAVSQTAREIAPKTDNIKAFHPLYDFYDRKQYNQKNAKKKLGLENKQVILFFGYIKPYKGLETLINCFPEVKNKYPDAVLLIVGEIYGDSDRYFNLIGKSAHKKSIIVHNEYTSDDKVELYFKAADLLALPYRSATQSGVIQIAYSMGVGVVVTPVGGLPAMVNQRETGIVAQSTSVDSFAQAIIEFLSLDRNRVNNRILSYSQELSWQKFVELILKGDSVKDKS